MHATKYLVSLLLIVAMGGCSRDAEQSANTANDSYEITTLLTCSETTVANDETQKTIYCEQPENGMTVEMVGPYVAALTTCNVNWQAMQDRRLNEYVFSDIVSNYFKSDPSGDSALIPTKPLEIFALPVKNFRSGFGLLPGFMVSIDSDFTSIKNALADVGIQFDQCDDQSCELKLTETEAIVLQNNLFGCVYPYQR